LFGKNSAVRITRVTRVAFLFLGFLTITLIVFAFALAVFKPEPFTSITGAVILSDEPVIKSVILTREEDGKTFSLYSDPPSCEEHFECTSGKACCEVDGVMECASVACASDADCDDGNPCTLDTCKNAELVDYLGACRTYAFEPTIDYFSKKGLDSKENNGLCLPYDKNKGVFLEDNQPCPTEEMVCDCPPGYISRGISNCAVDNPGYWSFDEVFDEGVLECRNDAFTSHCNLGVNVATGVCVCCPDRNNNGVCDSEESAPFFDNDGNGVRDAGEECVYYEDKDGKCGAPSICDSECEHVALSGVECVTSLGRYGLCVSGVCEPGLAFVSLPIGLRFALKDSFTVKPVNYE